MPSPEIASNVFEKYGLTRKEVNIELIVSMFSEKYGVSLDDTNIKTVVSSILINNNNPQDRETRLKEYVKDSFATFAIPQQQQRQITSIDENGHSLPMDAVAMLDTYIDVVSYIAMVVSNEQSEAMERAQEEAKKSAAEDVKNANQASDAANKAIANNEYGAKKKAEEAKALVEKAKLRRDRANDPNNFYFSPWEPTLPKFGLTSAEARQLYTDCVKSVNSFKFAEFRREEMHKVGAAHPIFMKVVNEIDANPDVTDYNAAKPTYQEALRNIYVTRELMNTHLGSLERKNWLWRFFNRAEIKAVRNYVNTADRLMAKVKFPEELKEPTMTAATTSSVRAGYSDVDDVLKEIDQVFAEVDQAVEANLQKQEAKRKEEEHRQQEKEAQEKLKKETEEKARKEKEEKHANHKAREQEARKAIVGHEAEINAEAEALAREKKPIPDAFFDIRFRPSWDQAESKRQSDMCAEIGNKYILDNKNLPAGVRAVFKANYAKLRAVRNFVKNDLNTLGPVELQKRLKELNTQFAVSEEMVKMEHASAGINYVPITFDQLKLQQDLAHDLSGDKVENTQPKEVEANKLQKENIQKNI